MCTEDTDNSSELLEYIGTYSSEFGTKGNIRFAGDEKIKSISFSNKMVMILKLIDGFDWFF